MSESLDSRAKHIFDQAIELQGVARSSLLNDACGPNADLRNRVEAFLRGAETNDSFLSDPTAKFALPSGDEPRVDPAMTKIGPYRLLELIGEGGFGSVYMAEQREPVKRRVALKIIKPGMDTRAVVARFEQERQALAMMDHPNIAKVLDAGATEAGRLYFVMELVKGEPITTFCDHQSLDIPQRLELFSQVCRAVQHAHTKGVIHRDIKPTNVLASEQDGRPFCKIIDFGIAKATQQPLTEKTVFTEFRQLVGTPEYMSPEQAAGSLDIDTRTDVYSLGVLLYELLTGGPPFDPKRLRSAAFEEMQRIIREVDPPIPSTRVSRSPDTIASIAAQRRTEPRKLGATIRGELDWIVMKALDKDRARRYDSAGNFAADIGRFLAGDAIDAAPPSVSYRIQKVVRRHQLAFSAGGVVALALIVGLGAALWQARIASRERDAAQRSAAAALVAKQEAETGRKDLERVAAFQSAQLGDIDVEAMGKALVADLLANAKRGMANAKVSAADIAGRQTQLAGLLGDVNPTDVALRTLQKNIFDRSLKAVGAHFKDRPIVKARLLQTIADTMAELGLLDAAAAPQAECLELRKQLLGNRHRDTIHSYVRAGNLFQQQGKLDEAEEVFRKAVEFMPREVEETSDGTGAVGNLGLVLHMRGKLAEAEKVERRSLEICRRVEGPDSMETIGAINNLGYLCFSMGKLADAESLFAESLARVRRLKGDDDDLSLALMNNLASVYQHEGKLSAAEPLFRDGRERSVRVRGADHPSSLQFDNNLGFLLYLQGKYAESEPLTRDILERRRRLLGDKHMDTLQSINNMGKLLEAQGKPHEAETYLREALEKRTLAFGKDHQATLQSANNLASFLISVGKLKEADRLCHEALEKRQKALGGSHPDTLESRRTMGRYLVASKDYAAAEMLLRATADDSAKLLGKDHFETAQAQCDLASALMHEKKFAAAETELLLAEGVLRTTLGEKNPSYHHCAKSLAELYTQWDITDPNVKRAGKAALWNGKF